MRSPRNQTALQEPPPGKVSFCPFLLRSFPLVRHQPVCAFAPAAVHRTPRTITSSSLALTSTCPMPRGQ